jgi:hypothetical protein
MAARPRVGTRLSVVGPSVGAMLIIAPEARRIVDEGAGHLEHEVRQVAWWRGTTHVVPAGQHPGEQPDQGRAERTPEPGEQVNEGRSTTWSRWA